MKTIILPGYSPHNIDWANQVANYLKPKLKDEIIVHNWQHWTKGSFSLKGEVEKITKEIENLKVNIIAKSVGTRVAMHLLTHLPDRINKLILCGIPSVSEEMRKYYKEGLKAIPSEKVVCFQNKKDPFVTFEQIKEFVGSIDKSIKVIEKPRSDHDYPYFEDFSLFLNN
jgi:pimeloyl-ACP methyl ester carboxylesterase